MRKRWSTFSSENSRHSRSHIRPFRSHRPKTEREVFDAIAVLRLNVYLGIRIVEPVDPSVVCSPLSPSSLSAGWLVFWVGYSAVKRVDDWC
ncbi:hypothetical protein C8039_17255 [Halogeometricum sp. wsp3]|nr:hypothetical protein C8039_17255 [Halogeometricum sp. wsp3]